MASCRVGRLFFAPVLASFGFVVRPGVVRPGVVRLGVVRSDQSWGGYDLLVRMDLVLLQFMLGGSDCFLVSAAAVFVDPV